MHDANELGEKVFHIEELSCQDFAGVEHDNGEDIDNLENRCSLEVFEWNLVDFKKWGNMETNEMQGELDDYFREWLDL